MASQLQIEVYKKLKALPIEELTWSECKVMDATLRDETIRILQQRVGRSASRPVAKFVMQMVKFNWGTVEVDKLCKEMNAYPEWA